MSTLYVTEPPTDGKVLLHTPKGEIEIELWSKEAPKACRNFVALALEGYYDHCVWHRIVPGFIIQTGDPTGTGHGGESFYGAPFENERHQRLRFHRRGLVAMANTGENNTNESQFFITLDATPELQNKYTIFGCVGGSTIYNVLSLADVEMSSTEPDRPVYPPKLLRAEVIHHPFKDLVPRITPAERQAQQEARTLAAQRQGTIERQRKRPKKNTTLLSFGDDEDVPLVIEKKPMSSHDLLHDKRLSKEAMPQGHPASKQPPASKPEPTPEQPPAPQPEPTSEQPPAPQLEPTPKLEPEEPRRQAPPAPSPSSVSSLAALLQAYKKDRGHEHDTLSRLDAFQKRMRSEAPAPPRHAHSHEVEDEDEQDMREYGDDEDDDADWRSHTFQSDGMPLQGNDTLSAHDYQVVDPRDTKTSSAASLNTHRGVQSREHVRTPRSHSVTGPPK